MDTETGKLYICATPIGNLGDMTARVVETLREVDLIAAEDTRNSLRLLNHFEIKTPMTSYHEHNKYEKAEELIGLLLSGKKIAVVTDAGTPCISDPGEVLVKRCIEEGIPVTSLPGASAVITALTLSGLPARHFYFQGFLPSRKQKREREEDLSRIAGETATIVLYEAPHHLLETLTDLKEAVGEGREIVLCRELTKIHEEVIRTTVGEALTLTPRGEYVLVLSGKSREQITEEKEKAFSEMSLEEHLQLYLDKGMEKKEAMKAVAKDRGLSKRDIYNALLQKGIL